MDTQANPEWWGKVTSSEGKRILVLDKGGIPKGWVVGKLRPDLQRKIKGLAIPIRPGGWHLFGKIKAKKYLQGIQEKYQREVVMLMVLCDETDSGWFTRPVFLKDFETIPENLIQEASLNADQGNFELCDMKECLYMALTGLRDLK